MWVQWTPEPLNMMYMSQTRTMPCFGKSSSWRLGRRSRRKGSCLIHSSSQCSRALMHQASTQPMHRDQTLSKRDRWGLSKTGLDRKLDPAFAQAIGDQGSGRWVFGGGGHSSPPETMGISTTTLLVPDALGEPLQTFPKNPEHVETNLFGASERQRRRCRRCCPGLTKIRQTEP